MLKLHAKLPDRWDANPIIGKVSTVVNERLPTTAFLQREVRRMEFAQGAISLPAAFSYLEDGDVVRFVPSSGDFSVLYRAQSPFNAMMVTEKCSSFCIMCSQPPRDVDDSYLFNVWRDTIPLMRKETPELGITGGEPTLWPEQLLSLITQCRDELPTTALHMLSNGRSFTYHSLCSRIAAIQHPDLVLGIPLYSDLPEVHDFVVQAKGAFDQTVRGIMNLKRHGLRVEIRFVIHAQTVGRIREFAEFMGRNLPFVDHVALMGLEQMGFAKANMDALWVDPYEYREALTEAVLTLDRHHVRSSIYNHQLCTLDRAAWPFATKSISDWKNEYVGECAQCEAKHQCGGFFSSVLSRPSQHIRAIIGANTQERT